MNKIQEFATKEKSLMRYNTQVIPVEMKESDIILKQVLTPTRICKLFPNWEGPYKI